MAQAVIRIKPLHYIHVLDNNTNVARVEIGPQTFTRQEHEKVVFGPEEMLKIPPRSYVVISNPVVRSAEGAVVYLSNKSIKLRHGDEEIRFEQAPFPLYPGESVKGSITPLQVVAPNSALRLRAVRDFTDGEVKRLAGDEWLFSGPGTYIPRIEVQVVELQRATIIKQNEALKLRARKTTVDSRGNPRRAGEEWLVKEAGAFLPGVDEEVVETIKAIVLTEKKALHLRAVRGFKDVYGRTRKAGEEWLVTLADSDTHIPDVHEEVVGQQTITTLSSRQYAVVLDPVGPNGKPQFGKRDLRKGEVSFFLQPGERLESGIQNVYVLGEDEALLLKAREAFGDKRPGDRWMIYGPSDYVPPVEVDVVEKRKAIPLDENEGIYVRDIKTGQVRAMSGLSYMLLPNEELWEKDLPPAVEDLLSHAGQERVLGQQVDGSSSASAKPRDKTRVVSYRAPHGSAVQVYDYRNKKSRVVFGPDLVMLGPDEHFTVLSISGGRPKKANQLRSLALLLGPDFMTDVVTVETSDHARLALQLAYNWHFEVDHENPGKIFSVPDFVGDACKAIASRVRGVVAASTFDNFHRNSAELICEAIFGKQSAHESTGTLRFSANNLIITNVDIQSVEPVDSRTRDSLQKSVQLAIEITTKSQEANARHEAECAEQQARGRLARQQIQDEIEAEKARKDLIRYQSHSAAVEATGQATAEAKARASAAEIEGESAVKQAELKAKAVKIKAEAEIEQLRRRQEAEYENLRARDEMEVQKCRQVADIEVKKFKEVVDAIGAETITTIAQAGPDMQAKLLSGLGLKSFMITDGHSPINLFNTAQGLIGGLGGPSISNLD